jgi:radical SAM protein with 4Fe4S-binding SPASM domain
MYLADRKAASGAGKPQLNLVFIIISQNHDGLFDFAEFATCVKADRVIFRPVDDFDDPGLKKVVPTSEQTAIVRHQLIEVKAYLESRRIAHNIDLILKVFGRQLDTSGLYRIIPCYYGWLWVMIDSDGKVYPCCRCYEPLGDIYRNNFSEIWHGNAYRHYRKETIKINRHGTPIGGCNCSSCANFDGNLRVYRALHPMKGRSRKLETVCPDDIEQEN